MANDYFRLKFSELSDKNIDFIVEALEQDPEKNFYINVKNTTYIDEKCLYKLIEYPNMYIRIEGGYDDNRIRNYPEYSKIHKYANIYSISEVARILKEIKNIESGIYPDWSCEQKLFYFISFLQDRMVYFLDNASSSLNEVRSLRGLYTRKTVCAGFSLILKELCDRNGIECDYVEGSTKEKEAEQGILSHAWNIVKMRGNYFPIDLTGNANKYIRGEDTYISYLCNASKFVTNHIPGNYEKLQNYESNLKSISSLFIRKVLDDMNQNKFFDSTKFYRDRKDGSKYLIYQLESILIGNHQIYKYVYCNLLSNNQFDFPIILYSSTNLSDFSYKMSKNLIHDRYKALIDELLFSKNNILQAIKKRNNYIGSLLYSSKTNDYKVVVEVNISKLFSNKKFKSFKRSNGSMFTVEYLDEFSKNINGHRMYCYNIYEYFYDENNIKLKVNKVYTNFNLFSESSREFASTYLGRKRIDDRVRNYGGYLGSYIVDGKANIDELEDKFSPSNRVELPESYIIDLHTELSFQDLKQLAGHYKIVCNNNKLYALGIKGGELIDSREFCAKVRFANLWVYAISGRATIDDDSLEVIFSEYNEKLFYDFCFAVNSFLCETGNIDTVGVLIYLKYLYKDAINDEVFGIITRLFSTNETNNIINTYFRLVNPSALSQSKDMEPLVDINISEKKANVYKKNLRFVTKDMLEVKKGMFRTVIKEYK